MSSPTTTASPFQSAHRKKQPKPPPPCAIRSPLESPPYSALNLSDELPQPSYCRYPIVAALFSDRRRILSCRGSRAMLHPGKAVKVTVCLSESATQRKTRPSIVDTEEQIARVVPVLNRVVEEGVVASSPVEAMRYMRKKA